MEHALPCHALMVTSCRTMCVIRSNAPLRIPAFPGYAVIAFAWMQSMTHPTAARAARRVSRAKRARAGSAARPVPVEDAARPTRCVAPAVAARQRAGVETTAHPTGCAVTAVAGLPTARARTTRMNAQVAECHAATTAALRTSPNAASTKTTATAVVASLPTFRAVARTAGLPAQRHSFAGCCGTGRSALPTRSPMV